ncbi:MAG: rhamnogalacturonan acetylesterase [Bacteroidaceae bacterium]|nr:rhamnogalacturonan acetylesterase [Bacteroidaceae bacterium]
MKRLTITILTALLGIIGATAQNNTGKLDVNGVRDVTLDSLAKANQVRPVSGSSRRGNNPVLFLVGNSTMRNGTLGNGNNGQWGWGYFAHEFFNEDKITVENHALGGTSPRTFYRRLWSDVLKGIQKGDYVILELGHNDNGPIDHDRARSSYKGKDGKQPLTTDSILVTIQETGKQEMVYSFGGYLRRFVNEIRAKGATPILFTLTPRKAYEESDTNRIDRKLTTFTPWIKAMSEELHTPYIDLNDISARKLETYGKWKADYHFFGDKIHSSEFGAKMNAASCAEGLEACNDPQIAELKSYILTDKIHPKSIVETHPEWVVTKPAKKNSTKKKPRVFLTGDSTVKNNDKDEDGMWGWGSQAFTVFDGEKCTVINAARAGRSTRTFLYEGLWDGVYNSIEPGDYVLIQFGHNDIGDIDTKKERAVIRTAADTCHVYKMESNGQYKVIYSFGWYLKKFIQDVREKGGTPILVSLTPRNEWPNGKVERRNDSYGRWYREVVEATGVDFIDLHNITADALDKMGKEKAAAMFNHDHTHTSLAGARLNAKGIAKGLKQIKSPLRKCLK